MATKSVLHQLRDALRLEVGALLHTHGFTETVNLINRSGLSLVYRCQDAYVAISATLDPRDAPFTLLCSLGQGPHEWPEADWNKVALWRFAKDVDPDAVNDLLESLSYSSDLDGEAATRLAKQCLSAVQRYGTSFLQGDRATFSRIRSAVNAAREPYWVVSRAADGSLQRQADPSSEALRRKYMQ